MSGPSRLLILSTVLCLPTLADATPPNKGMTWASYGHDPFTGTDSVSCHGGNRSCEPYVGDTSCSRFLPILCIHAEGSTNPGATTSTPYLEWAGGNIATTLAVQGSSLGSVADADTVCEDSFGTGWRMAEFHDGWGWGFVAFGHVRSDTRFWVYIDDQPANCWN